MGEQRKTSPRLPPPSAAPFTERELGNALNAAFSPGSTQLSVEPVSSPRLASLVQEELQTLNVRIREHEGPHADGEVPTLDTEDTSPMLPQAEAIWPAAEPKHRTFWASLPLWARAGLVGGGLAVVCAVSALGVLFASGFVRQNPGRGASTPMATSTARELATPSSPQAFPLAQQPPAAPAVSADARSPTSWSDAVAAVAHVPSPSPGEETASKPEDGPKPDAAPVHAPRRIKGTLEPADVVEVVTEHRDALVVCVEHERSLTPDLEGVLMMHLSVKASGRVESARATTPAFRGSSLEDCLGEEIRSWRFPRHRTTVPPFDFPFKL